MHQLIEKNQHFLRGVFVSASSGFAHPGCRRENVVFFSMSLCLRFVSLNKAAPLRSARRVIYRGGEEEEGVRLSGLAHVF